MTTYIDIDNLLLYAPVGVMEQEQIVKGRFEVSMRLYYDAEAAMVTDNIADAVNYAAVTELVVTTMQQPCALLEHAARRIVVAVTERFSAITAGRLTITKLHPPIPAPTPRVSLSVEW